MSLSFPTDDSVWVVVPAYREGSRIAGTLTGLTASYRNVVVVDDGSPDNTGEAARAFPVWLLRHAINLGQGAALKTGIDFALEQGAAFIVTFDGDGQHTVADIENLLAPLRSDTADVALGSRFLGHAEGIPASRRLLLKAATLFTRVFSRIAVTDTHNGIRAMNRKAAQNIQITQNRMAHASEILDQIKLQNLRYTEVAVTVRYTAGTLEKGQSSWNSFRIVGQLLLGRIVK